MSQPKRDYDSTVARIAGNIAAGLVGVGPYMPEYGHGFNEDERERLAAISVTLARAIVAEVRRTEPPPEPKP